jgi:hypothetical protein
MQVNGFAQKSTNLGLFIFIYLLIQIYMSIDVFRMLMREVDHIRNHYEKIIKISGGHFNIFQILGLESNEVRLHSTLLTELLNPNGSHGQGDTFLKLFVEKNEIIGFDTTLSVAETEKYISPVNSDYSQGGRIDIIVTDKKNHKNIIIENKIYAADQQCQLLRYYNFDKNASLFYLTLDGSKPTNWSTKGKIENYKTISYKEDIINWLESCLKESASLPIIRETISQYINLLKVLTHQTTKGNMLEDLKKIILNNPDYINSIEESYNALVTLVAETKKEFKRKFDELFPRQIIWVQDNSKIEVAWGEDGDGIYFGYQYYVNGSNSGNSEKAKQFGALLKEIDCSIHASPWNFGWFNPEPTKRFHRFDHLDKKEILKMNQDQKYLEQFIERLIFHENRIRKEFLKQILDTEIV